MNRMRLWFVLLLLMALDMDAKTGYPVLNRRVCDTVTVEGYLVLGAQKNKTTGRFDTFFGLVENGEIIKSVPFQRLLAYRTDTNIFIRQNISVKDYYFLKSNIDYAVLHNVSGLYKILINSDVCLDTAVRDYAINNSGINTIRLPNIESYGVAEQFINIDRPFFSIKYIRVVCVIIKRKSFNSYYREFMNNNSTQPYSFSFTYRINILKIAKACAQNGYYLLAPIKLL